MISVWSRTLMAACAAIVVISGSLAHGQETIQQVKALYASAAYEDALTMVTRLQAANRRPEVEQYRVFCLVALGRTAEAEKAIETVLSKDPSFVPDAEETSPRIQAMFVRIRRTLIPEIAQRMYVEAKAAFDRKEMAAARSQFESLLQLIDGNAAVDNEEPMLGELRLLASGFVDLSKAMPAAPASPPAPVASSPPPLELTSPVPVKQNLPVWVPPDPSSHREFRGAIRVFISDAGRVTGAELSQGIHPVYDRLLLQAARAWEYQPALKNGAPIPSEKVIEVVLKPR
jgi:tetratricopeptide (TPR) repeat protein